MFMSVCVFVCACMLACVRVCERARIFEIINNVYMNKLSKSYAQLNLGPLQAYT